MKNEHVQVDVFKCDKCIFEGTSRDNLEIHRRTVHYYFIYYCAACNFDTTNRDLLKEHRNITHSGMIFEVKKEKVFPPPKCNPEEATHTTNCCDSKQQRLCAMWSDPDMYWQIVSNPEEATHTTNCCDRNPRNKKAAIYSKQKRLCNMWSDPDMYWQIVSM